MNVRFPADTFTCKDLGQFARANFSRAVELILTEHREKIFRLEMNVMGGLRSQSRLTGLRYLAYQYRHYDTTWNSGRVS